MKANDSRRRRIWTRTTVVLTSGLILTGCLLDFSTDRVDGPAVCGNGVLQAGEVCDDGNTLDGDNCSADCRVDLSLCGNGQVDSSESCDDGNRADGDGCSAMCQVEECGAARCPSGCCSASGACLPGTQDEACGTGGLDCADCSAAVDQACQAQACADLGPCTPPNTQDCGNCGTRTCQTDETWGPCEAQGACSPGQVTAGATCGMCGHEEQVCDNLCAWGDWACVDELGDCIPGTEETGNSCGSCSVEVRTCQAGCTWTEMTCTAGGVCSPGQTDTGSSCGDCGVQERTCTAQCDWGGWSCTDEGVCTPNTTETGSSCGDCGQQERTCTSQCNWGNWGCANEGVCTPNDTDTGIACGTCGVDERTCNAQCTWGSWSCNEPGDCITGMCDVSCAEMDVCGSTPYATCVSYCEPDLTDCSTIELGEYAVCNAVLPGVACNTWSSWSSCVGNIACVGN